MFPPTSPANLLSWMRSWISDSLRTSGSVSDAPKKGGLLGSQSPARLTTRLPNLVELGVLHNPRCALAERNRPSPGERERDICAGISKLFASRKGGFQAAVNDFVNEVSNDYSSREGCHLRSAIELTRNHYFSNWSLLTISQLRTHPHRPFGPSPRACRAAPEG